MGHLRYRINEMTINTTKTTAQLKGLQLDLFCTVCCFLSQMDALGSRCFAHAPTGFYHVYCLIMTKQARVNFFNRRSASLHTKQMQNYSLKDSVYGEAMRKLGIQ